MYTGWFSQRLNTKKILEKYQNWVDAKPSAQHTL